MTNFTERFSNRVENYVRFRPHYPEEVIEWLRENFQLSADKIIADVGSGTGILAEMFLKNGNVVYGVEPNQEMRKAGEQLLQSYARFISINGTAETTTLHSASVDFVTAGQAFHWFDQDKAKAEFKRILKPQGRIVLVWNERIETTTPFLRDYEQLLRTYATDYQQVNHKRIGRETLNQFFDQDFKFNTFENSQNFDFEGLKGRLLSSSYAPEVGHPQHQVMIKELERIFNAHQVEGKIDFAYNTNLYCG